MRMGWLCSLAVLVLHGFAMGSERAAFTANTDSEFQTIYEVSLQLPYGQSLYEQRFDVARGDNPLRINFLKSAACPQSPGVWVDVLVEKTQLWERTSVINNLDYYSGGAISGIRFSFTQPFYQFMNCTFVVQSRTGLLSTPPAKDKEILVGALDYAGGYSEGLEVSLLNRPFVTRVRLQVPKFCGDAEVLEVGTITEGTYDKSASTKELNTFVVNGGAGSRISAIRVAMNGPHGQSCSIPVYLSIVE